jgi:cytochrome c553
MRLAKPRALDANNVMIRIVRTLFFCTLACGFTHAAVPDPKARDTIAERVVPCTGCHGKEGRATPEGFFPRIAAKPAGYLFNQLVHFREGRRHYALMTYLVEHLTDEYLYEMAEYFARLDVPYAPPAAAALSPETASRGEALVRQGDAARNIPACAECHGSALMGANPAIPGLLGHSRDYLQAQLGRWKTGERRAHAPDCMAKIAAQLTPADVAAVSAWLAAQPIAAGAKPAAHTPSPLPMPCGGASRVR